MHFLTDQPPLLPEEPDATLKPPQFSLRTLLIATTAAAGLLSVMMAVGTLWSLAILFFVTLIAAHVIGNSLGTRLRDGSTRRRQRRPSVESGRPAPSNHRVVTPTRLRERNRLHWIHLVLMISGAVAGGYYGGKALADTYPEATMAAHILAYASSGVLGGFAMFVVSSFIEVVRQAVREAHAGSDRRGPKAAPGPDSVSGN